MQFRSRSVRGYDTYRGDDLEAASARLQLAAAGCLVSLGRLQDGLGRYEVSELLLSPLGEAAIKLAIRHRCKHFLSQPPVQVRRSPESVSFSSRVVVVHLCVVTFYRYAQSHMKLLSEPYKTIERAI